MNLYQKHIVPYAKIYKKTLLSTILLGTLTILSAAMLTFTSGYLISRTSERPENILLVYIPIVAVRTFGISRAALRYVERLLGHNAVLKIIADMRVHLYRVLEPQALFIRSRFQTGDLLGTLADDIEHLQDVYIRTLFPTVIGLFLYSFSVIVLAVYDWKFAIIMALCLGIVAFVYPMASLYLMKKNQQQSKKLHSQLYNTMTEGIFGLRDWIISGRKEQFLSAFQQESHASHEMDKKLAYWQQSRTAQLQIFSGLLVLVVGVWAGQQAAEGLLVPTYIAAFTLVTLPILEGLIPVSHALERIPAYEASLQRIDHIHQQNPGSQLPLELVEEVRDVTIALDAVSYRYEGQSEDAVQNLTLSIQQGEKVAVLGKSGAGKSTLIQLLLGTVEPTNGSVQVNEISASRFGDTMYDVISVLNQKPYLFATTVENNIKLGNSAATAEDVQRVVEQVGLATYLQSLPAGSKTQMEETGQRFSGGERQRIALARILLKQTPVVILDEPTVGLDPVTEHSLVETIHQSLADKTVVWITHHLMGMEKMDKIVFMEDGKIVMQGTHKELLTSNKRYRKLYELDMASL
ncbi:thiol reductant ABC exporter subunit CydC [Sporosarcina sp. GW1-11]|uniref:thiol reductant ABC exporter subunit CydC n=1 Tax=Sporosarcina sp. GW1-11 TaxID=2899126 RepID=UPI00294D97A2|nr:thiol reductant ABC exporter subunit CydC [Sporosarcina sp. GW1-11]MDV6378107.1 thiol reductant ABC exporter subunit CydC [Sporosarcina sp. GW1-11]